MVLYIQSFLILVIHTYIVCSASQLNRFTPREKPPGTEWTGGFIGPKASQDTLEEKLSCPCTQSNADPSVASLRSLFTTLNDLFRLRGGDWEHKWKSAAYSWQEVIFQLRCRQEIPILGSTMCYKMLRWASEAVLWTRHRIFVFQKLCANSWLADSRSVLKDYVPQQRPDLTLTVRKMGVTTRTCLITVCTNGMRSTWMGKNDSKAEKQQLLNQLPKRYVASMSRSC